MKKVQKSFLQMCISHWRWFAVSTIAMTITGVLFQLVVTPLYRRTTDIMVKDETSPGSMLSSMTGMNMFANMGFNITSNVDNELEVFLSPALMMKVVKDNHLDVTYTTDNWFTREERYGETLPIKAQFGAATDADKLRLRATLHEDGAVVLTDFEKNKEQMKGEVSGHINSVCVTPLGPVTLISTPAFQTLMRQAKTLTITITKQPPYEMAERCLKRIKGDVLNNNTSIVQLSYDDAFSSRAELILNELTRVYLQAWQADKDEERQASTNFINQRITEIEEALSQLDGKLADYEHDNLLEIGAATPNAMAISAADINEMMLKLSNQRYVLKHMQQLISKEGDNHQVLPGNILPDNDNIAKQIANYNTLVLKRQNLAANSSERNPLVRDLDAQIAPMHNAIAASISHALSQIEIQLKGVVAKEQELTGKAAELPTKKSKMLPTKRQQKVIESLYVYLLQKREENGIDRAFNNKNIRVVTPPMGKLRPIFPRKLWTFGAAWLLALLLPMIVLYIRQLNDTEETEEEKTA